MIVVCDVCNVPIKDARMSRTPDGTTITLDVFCHGEKDSMTFTEEWIAYNQDFVFMIENNLTVGHAFSKKETD